MAITLGRILESINATMLGPPCDAEDIERAEAVLGQELPAELREVYLAVDGFDGPTNIDALWRIRGDGDASMAGYNVSLRGEEHMPSWARETVFYGGDGVGGLYGIRRGVPGVIRWILADFEDCVVVAPDILSAWAGLQARHVAAVEYLRTERRNPG